MDEAFKYIEGKQRVLVSERQSLDAEFLALDTRRGAVVHRLQQIRKEQDELAIAERVLRRLSA